MVRWDTQEQADMAAETERLVGIADRWNAMPEAEQTRVLNADADVDHVEAATEAWADRQQIEREARQVVIDALGASAPA